jgi:hypothetical protein
MSRTGEERDNNQPVKRWRLTMSKQWRRGSNGCWESDDITVWTTTRMIDDSNKADQASVVERNNGTMAAV